MVIITTFVGGRRIMFRSIGLRRRPGFTLVELLVVIAIIGVLMALLLPAVQKVREAARRTANANKMRQIAVAMHTYDEAYNILPPTFGWGPQDATHTVPGPWWNPGATYKVEPGGALGTAFFHILPFVEQQDAYNASWAELSSAYLPDS